MNPPSSTTTTSSRLYYPFRVLGAVTDGLPFALSRRGDECFLVVSIDRAFQIYHCDHLRVVLVSPPMSKRITCLETWGNEHTVVGCDSDILLWRRLTCLRKLGSHPGTVRFLLCLGDVLISLCTEGRLKSWNLKRPRNAQDRGVEHDMPSAEADGDADLLICEAILEAGFMPSALAHPPTYLNKILLGSEHGVLQLWNVRSGRRIHTFECLKAEGAAVCCIEPSPALDVAAVGLSDGRVQVLNLKRDLVLMTFKQATAVKTVSFRTDSGAAEVPILASAGGDGRISLWDLKERRLHHTMGAHKGGISRLQFLPREPVLVSSGADNCLKMWVFDAPDGTARLLRSREGHHAPPRSIRYYGNTTLATMAEGADATALCVLSAGTDRSFRVFHTVRDCLSQELSQKPLLKAAMRHQVTSDDNVKLRPVLSFAASETRARDWCNIITCHEDDSNAYVWSYSKRVIGTHVLRQKHWPGNSLMHPPDPNTFATCVAISGCGDFGLVGTRGGHVFRYNMQSGEPRGSYPESATPSDKPAKALKKMMPGSVAKIVSDSLGSKHFAGDVSGRKDKAGWKGHSGAVSGVAVDAMNKIMISAGVDGLIILWNFKDKRVNGVLALGSGVCQLELVRDTDLLALACEDKVVRLYDLTTRKLVRRLAGHTNQLTDMTFTPDARRLVTSSMDHTVRIWDLPTGRCVDWMRFKKAVTGVTVSPTGEFLCTSHHGRLGLSVWADQSFFQPVYLDEVPSEPFKMDEPTPMVEDRAGLEADQEEGSKEVYAEYHQDKRALRGVRAVSESASKASRGDPDHDGFERSENDSEIGYNDEAGTMGEDGSYSSSGDRRRAIPITLSSLPRGYWATLFNLEVVKARNKPIEPPKKPEAAPFFLPTTHRDGEAAPSFPQAGTAAAKDAAAAATAAAALSRETGETDETGNKAAGPLELPLRGIGSWSDDGDGDGEDDDENAAASTVGTKGGAQEHRSKRFANGTGSIEEAHDPHGAAVSEASMMKDAGRSAGRKRQRRKVEREEATEMDTDTDRGTDTDTARARARGTAVETRKPEGGSCNVGSTDSLEVQPGALCAVGKGQGQGQGQSQGETLITKSNVPMSRIMRQLKTAVTSGSTGLSRCKLADLLLECEERGNLHLPNTSNTSSTKAQKCGSFGEDSASGSRGSLSLATLASFAFERQGGKFGPVLAYLKKLPPSKVDVEMSLLCQGEWDIEGVHLVGLAMDFLLEELRSRKSFEVVQAYLHRFLRHYSDLIMAKPVLRESSRALREEQDESSRRIKRLVQHNLCLVSYLSNQQS